MAGGDLDHAAKTSLRIPATFVRVTVTVKEAERESAYPRNPGHDCLHLIASQKGQQ